MDRYRTSIWEAVGLSEIQKNHFDVDDEDVSGIEERLPAATASGSSFYAGGSSKDETIHTAIDTGDSSFATSRRHEIASSSSNYDASRRGGFSDNSFAGHYNGSVTIDAKRGGGYAVVPTEDRGVGAATITHTSRFNTTYIDGKPIGRTYENTTIVKDAQGRVIDTQKQYSQKQTFAQGGDVVYTGASGGSSQPYPVHIPTTTHHFDWGAPAGGRQEQQQHFDNRVEGSVQYNRNSGQESQRAYGEAHQYYDRNGHVAGGYQNKYDREYHSGGQDLRGYGGNDRRYDQEQLGAAVGSQHQQSAIENAAAGHGFRTNVINMEGGAGKDVAVCSYSLGWFF